ncbi:MAG: hypothetical protein KBD78_15850 [Oligoflexales bacterium]|nr:hypothetical protein [Oligoflexales bacterium]
MKAQLIVETLKVLISLGCPGFEDLRYETKIYWDAKNITSSSGKASCKSGCDGLVDVPFTGGGMVSGAYLTGKELSGGGGGGITQILVKTKDGYEPLEDACKREKEKLRKLLWEKKK